MASMAGPGLGMAFLFLLFGEMNARMVTIHNDVPRTDSTGQILNAHDGGVYLFNHTYFLYGTVYENCTQQGTQCTAPCGYNPNRFALYTSEDLISWVLQTSDILPEMGKDSNVINYWMPNVQMNPKTKKYVMQFWSSHCGFVAPCANLAIADSPYGPFAMVPPVSLHGGTPSSQMGLFVDADGTAFVKYNTIGPDQHHVVEKLSDDWLSSTGEWAIVFWKPTLPWMEGGGMFKRNDLYYYMTGSDCCFCTWGGDARVWTSRQPLGPWHPGMAPALPTVACDLSGEWTSGGALGNETLFLTQLPGSNNFTFRDAHGSATGWIDQATGYVTFPPSAGDARGVATSHDGTRAGCDRIRWYGYESFIWCRAGLVCPLPSYRDALETNFCADGSEPAQGVRVNPCDPGVQYGQNFTVPAQQFNVISVPVADSMGQVSTTILYYGERANSAPDRLFSHNFQAWEPLAFDDTGAIQALRFPRMFALNLSEA